MRTETSSPHRLTDAVHVVEFYPSLDDYIYICTKLTESTPATPATTYAYHAVLFVNAIVFPAFLWLNGYFVGGFVVFGAHVGAFLALVPIVDSDRIRKYYASVFGERENRIARVELSNAGLLYSANDCYLFWTWESIESVEETEDSIIFFSEGNGLGVRKSGFAYQDEQKQFSDFANSRMKAATVSQLSE